MACPLCHSSHLLGLWVKLLVDPSRVFWLSTNHLIVELQILAAKNLGHPLICPSPVTPGITLPGPAMCLICVASLHFYLQQAFTLNRLFLIPASNLCIATSLVCASIKVPLISPLKW